jgi:hypothetical protein
VQRIAYLTVTIPVDLDADEPTTNTDWWNKAALAGFMDHPAIREPHNEYLGLFVDEIRFEDLEAQEGDAVTEGEV